MYGDCSDYRLEYLMHVLDLEDYFRLDVDHQADSTKSVSGPGSATESG